jgi:uncharacterized paraquat-inducible protein A
MKKLVLFSVLLLATSAGAATIKVKSEKWGDVNFPHRTHVQKAKVACGECHISDSQNDMLTKKGHGPCKGCHIEKKGPVFCQDCHTRRK